MTKEKLLAFSMLLFLMTTSCARDNNLIRRITIFSNNNNDVGCIVVPTINNSFMIIDNAILRGRVFYDHYRNYYPNYESFLLTALTNPDSIDYLSSIGYYNCYRNKAFSFISIIPFSSFSKLYLKTISDCEFEVKNQESNRLPYILKRCFDYGYYIYPPGYSGKWIISKQFTRYPASGELLDDNIPSLPPKVLNSDFNQYKFIGKEWDSHISSYDFGARYYSPVMAKWGTQDPLAEDYYIIVLEIR